MKTLMRQYVRQFNRRHICTTFRKTAVRHAQHKLRQETASGLSARVLWLEYDDNPYFDVVQLNLNAEYEFLILFETSDIPTSEPTAKYTSYPFGWNAINDPVILDHAPAKKLRNGILYIERDGQIYTILGHKNTSICN